MRGWWLSGPYPSPRSAPALCAAAGLLRLDGGRAHRLFVATVTNRAGPALSSGPRDWLQNPGDWANERHIIGMQATRGRRRAARLHTKRARSIRRASGEKLRP